MFGGVDFGSWDEVLVLLPDVGQVCEYLACKCRLVGVGSLHGRRKVESNGGSPMRRQYCTYLHTAPEMMPVLRPQADE